MALIDLSHPIDENMTNHPYDDPVKLTRIRFLEQHHYNDWRLETGMHAGTHIDSPMHLTDDPRYIGEYPPDRFCGKATCLDVRGLSDINPTREMEKNIQINDIVLFCTGHYLHYGTPGYYSGHPVLSPETADLLITKKVKIAGFDLPSPDNPPFIVHKKLFAADIFILENLTDLQNLCGRRFLLYAFPLKIKADSSPARVIAESQDQE